MSKTMSKRRCAYSDSENSCSPAPDVFRKKITLSSVRMSLRKRVPLKKINANQHRNEWKEDAKKSNVAKKASASLNVSAKKQLRSIEVERSVKKTFYRVTEIAGRSKKSQLKGSPDVSTPRTRYREVMATPPMTPQSLSPYDSSVCVSPLAEENFLPMNLKRMPHSRKRRSTTPLNTGDSKISHDSDHFSNHLEMISCGIQKLETNEKRMTAAIRSMGLEYLSSPVHPKFKRKHRAQNNPTTSAAAAVAGGDFAKRRITRSVTDSQLEQSSSNVRPDKNAATTRGTLRRTITRMSMRVRGRSYSSKFPNESEPQGYVGPSYHKYEVIDYTTE